MTLSERIRKIREYRGLKQVAVAQEMNITQQAYSWLETKSDNAKIDTLKIFAPTVEINLEEIYLEPNSTTLDNVTIETEKDAFQQNFEKVQHFIQHIPRA